MALGLGFLFTAKDMASGTVNSLRNNIGKLGMTAGKDMAIMQKAMVGVGAATAVMGAGIGGLAIANKVASDFGAFEQSLAAVGAVTKASAADMAMLKDSAIQAGIATQFSPDEATQGLLSLATAGQTAKDATQTLIPVLDLAAGSLGQLGVAEAAEAVVGTLNSYQIATEEAGKVTDKLLRITQLTNFQTRDFQVGLSKAAAAGAVFKQPLDDVLITMGLIRNANIDASSAATGFRESMRRIGTDKKAQEALEKFGVSVFDANGNIRTGLDIMQDFAKATENATDKEAMAAVTRAFGARGMLAFNAAAKATFTKTLPDGSKQVLKGSKAIEALRANMDNAGGTAADFREKLLDTFEGQKTLLRGTMQTLSITTGDAFAQLFKPIVSAVTNFLNMIIKAINATPAPIKKVFAGLFVLVSSIVAVGGAVGLLTAAFALLLPIIKIAAIGFGVMTIAALPLIALFGGIALAVAGFKTAIDKNVGGIADNFGGMFSKIKLGAKALFQFFAEGKISGEVAKELSKAQNEGVLNFVNKIVSTIEAVKKFFAGIGKGFSKTIDTLGPAFDRLMNAFSKLGKALGFLSEEEGPDAARGRMEKFGAAGERVGEGLARTFEGIVNAISAVVEWIGKFVEAFKGADIEMKTSKSTLAIFGRQMAGLGDAFQSAGKEASNEEKEVSRLRSTIETISTAVNIAASVAFAGWAMMATTARVAIGTIRGALDILYGAAQFAIGGLQVLFGDSMEGFRRMGSGIKAAVMGIIKILATLAKATNAIAKTFGLGFDEAEFDRRIAGLDAELGRRLGVEAPTPTAEGPPGVRRGVTVTAAPGADAEQLFLAQQRAAMLAPVAEAARAAEGTAAGASLQTFLSSMQTSLSKLGGPQPITIQVTAEIDGEVVAQKIENRTGAESSFAPGGAAAGK